VSFFSLSFQCITTIIVIVNTMNTNKKNSQHYIICEVSGSHSGEYENDNFVGYSPNDGGSKHVWNISPLPLDYTALYPRKLSSSLYHLTVLVKMKMETVWWNTSVHLSNSYHNKASPHMYSMNIILTFPFNLHNYDETWNLCLKVKDLISDFWQIDMGLQPCSISWPLKSVWTHN
jgi:hypothetical protein